MTPDPICVLTFVLAALLLAAGWRVRRTGCLRGFGKAETLPLRGLLALLVVLGHLNNRRGFLLRALPKLLLPVLILAGGCWIFQFLSGGRFHGLHHIWYVKCLLLFYVISFVAFRFVPRHALALVALAVFGYWFSMRFLHGSKPYWWLTCFAFPAGFLFSAGEARIREFVLRRSLSACVILTTVLLAASVRIAEPFYMVLGPAGAFCLYAFNGLARFSALCFLGTCSYEIYLVHGIFEYGFLGNGWPSSVYFVAVLVATLFVAVPLHWIDVKALGLLRRRIAR